MLFGFMFCLHVPVYAYFISMSDKEIQKFRVQLFHKHCHYLTLQNSQGRFMITSIYDKLGF
jgi:hypothetical protein